MFKVVFDCIKFKLLIILLCVFRVNLIGEHIDYCGYPVLPMAIEQSILLAVAPSEERCLHITNTNDRYKPLKCSIDNVTYDTQINRTFSNQLMIIAFLV